MRPSKTFFLSMILSIVTCVAHAGSVSPITYQGRVLKPDGNPLEVLTNFRFTIKAPNGCILWQEDQSINLATNKGAFTALIGANANAAPGSHTFPDIFNNSRTLTGLGGPLCTAPFQYAPSLTDDRTLEVSFNDGSGSQNLPAMTIQNVPFAAYAGYAQEVLRMFGKVFGGAAPTLNGQTLIYNQAQDRWEIGSPAGGGTVTSVDFNIGGGLFTMSGGPITGAGTISAALATQNANMVFAGPSSGGAAAPTFRTLGTLDIPALPASKITSGTLATAVLGVVPGANGGTVTQIDTGAGLIGGPINFGGTISLGTTSVVPGLYGSSSWIPNFIVDAYGRLTSAGSSAIALDASAIATGTLALATLPASGVTAGSYGSSTHIPTLSVDAYGRITTAGSVAVNSSQWSNIALGINYATGGSVGVGVAVPNAKLDVNGASRSMSQVIHGAGTISLLAPASGDFSLRWPSGVGSTGQVLLTDGTGNLSWGTVAVGASSQWVNNSVGINYSSGSVGIGTSTPSSPLSVYSQFDPIASFQNPSASGFNEIEFKDNGGTGRGYVGYYNFDQSAFIQNSSGTGGVQLQVGSGSDRIRMHVLPSGSIGVATSSPVALFDINGSLRSASQSLAGAGSITLLPPASGNYSMRWPSGLGSNGQVLSMNGSGTLGWVSAPMNGGTFLAADGSAGTPGISFSADTDTGMYRVGNNSIGFATNGANRVIVNDSGIGVGIAPTAPLHLYGAGAEIARLENTSNGSPTITRYAAYDGGGVYRDGYFSLVPAAGTNQSYFVLSSFTQDLFSFKLNGQAGFGTMNVSPGVGLEVNTGAIKAANRNEVQFGELLSQGTNFVSLRAPGTLAANTIWTLPAADGSTGNILITDGTGNLSWGTLAASAPSQWNNIPLGINYIAGSVGIGVAAPDARFHVFKSLTDFNNYETTAMVATTISPPAPTSNSYRGMHVSLNVNGTNAFNGTENAVFMAEHYSTNPNTRMVAVNGSANSFGAGGGGFTGLYGLSSKIGTSDSTHVGLRAEALNQNANGNAFWLTGATTAAIASSGTTTNATASTHSVEIDSSASVSEAHGIRIMYSGSGQAGFATGLNIGNVRGSTKWSIYSTDATAPSFINGNMVLGTTDISLGTKLDVSYGAIKASARGTTAGNGGEVRFGELLAGGTNWVALRAPDALAANLSWELPSVAGTSGQVLGLSGAGTLGWVSAPANGGTFLAASGSIGTPSISFMADQDTGFYNLPGGDIGITLDGINAANFTNGGFNIYRSVRSDNGSPASPHFSFALDTDTGMLTPGANTLAFSTGGTTKMTITSAGSVGIGTATPVTMLDVAGAIRASGQFDENTTVSGVYSGIYASPRILFANGNAGQNWQIDNTGGLFRWFTPANTVMELAVSPSNQVNFYGGLTLKNGANEVKIRAPTAGSIAFSLPTTVGSSGQVLTTDGTGNMSWASAGASSINGLSDARTGAENVFLAHEAPSLTTGSFNTTVGGFAGYGFTTGAENTAIGQSAMRTETNGVGNVAVGARAMQNSTNLGYNVAIGLQSLRSANTGTGNIAIGGDAMAGLLSGDGNVAVGIHAMINSGGTMSNNAAVGIRSLANVRGSDNIAMGYESGYYLTTGTENTHLGKLSGHNNTTGDQNVTIGVAAGGWNAGTTGDMDNNTVVGAFAGRNMSGGASGLGANQNVLFGSRAGENITTGDRNIVIGYDIDAPSASGSDQLNIGNLIFGTYVNGSNAALSTGSIGIGTNAPTAKLEVNGDIKVYGNNMFRLNSNGDLSYQNTGVWANGSFGTSLFSNGSNEDIALSTNGTIAEIRMVTNAVERMTILPNGSVGIGTTGIAAKLHVAGNILANGAVGSAQVTYSVAPGTTTPVSGGIDMRLSNTYEIAATVAGNCPTTRLDFTTMTNGLNYTIALTGYNAGTCTFQDQTGATTNIRFYGGAAPTLTGAEDVVCSAVKVGSRLYLSCLNFP